VTYRELDELAERLAARLEPWVAPDRAVAILLQRDSHWLYVAQLAVLKAGGAFTCIDPQFPNAHVQAVLDDGEISVVLTDEAGSKRSRDGDLRATSFIDVPSTAVSEFRESDRAVRAVRPEHLAYVIYTSGTTGTPKGVMIEHRSVVNLVLSDVDEFRLTPDDRVAQGSSAAYDSSIEETWLALSVGATLVVMDDQTSRMGPDLVDWLRQERITVFCPPPTLLRATGCVDPASALPDLRLLYVGGEALPEDLADRWGAGRRLVNGYGPTECTVTVVRGDVVRGRPVTIGRPVRGHTAWVVDADLNAVADGESGELCIAGAGLARGYHKRDEVTREKFQLHPLFGRIYRTGDLVRREPTGELSYLGRIDAQIKLRGYRVELEAIEACLAKCEGVREAACRVQGEGGDALLAAHVVATDPTSPPSLGAVKESLRRSLPAYMVPARLAIIDSLPRSVGGKLARSRLPELGPEASDRQRPIVLPNTPTEGLIVGAFAAALKRTMSVSAEDDFFVELGGDSLSAVEVVLLLRRHPETASITTRDLYEARTASGLAARIQATPTKRSLSRPEHCAVSPGSAHPFMTTIGQGVCLLLTLVVASLAANFLCFDLTPLLLERFGILGTGLLGIPLAALGMGAYAVLSVVVTVVLKLALIGEYRPIRARVWSWYYFRHWIVQSVARTIPWNVLAGTVAYGVVLRLLGARIGERVTIGRGVDLHLGGWDLLTLGDDVTLSRDSRVGLVELAAGCVCVGPVVIERGATLDIRASVGSHTALKANAFLTALSWLPSGETIPEGMRWNGIPASPDGLAPATPIVHTSQQLNPAIHAVLHLLAAALTTSLAPLSFLLVVYAGATILDVSAADVVSWISAPTYSTPVVAAALLSPLLTVPCWLIVRGVLLRAMGRVGPSTMSQRSFASMRVWHKAAEVESVGTWLTGTLFWPLWLRLAGMRVGRGCEISTIIDVVPETIQIGSESFFADGIYLGGPRVHRGTVTVLSTSLGSGTFLGNHVVIPTGADLPDGLFVGVCTVAESTTARPGTSWFGHPALELPRREVVSTDPRLTHRPGLLRYCNRLFWESLRFAIPALPMAIGMVWLWIMSKAEADSPLTWLVIAPAAVVGALAAGCFAVVALKWILLGRAREGRHPLWSCWCSRWDFLYVAWQFYALRTLASLEGTLFLAMYLRLMGVRIGRRVVLGPGLGQLADPDMIIIEDDATVSANYQAHSFEDRILKLAPVFVRKGATVGESAVVFYGADIGEGSWVTPNSVVMKNERTEPSGTYSGCPVQAYEPPAVETVPEAERPDTDRVREPTIPGQRYAFLDVARGLAVVGMIFMHCAPEEGSDAGASVASSVLIWLSGFLHGKSAALFFVLAGVAWELQAQRSAHTAGRLSFLLRRAFTLATAGVLLHVLAWPTEVLVPLALMMVISSALRYLGRRAMVWSVLVLLTLAPCVPAFLGDTVASDWNDDGSHAADHALGWVTVRALLIDGNYPVVPWLAFPLIGMLMTRCWEDSRSNKLWFGAASATFLAAQALVLLVGSLSGSLGGVESQLANTWDQTASLSFVLITGGAAGGVVTGLAWWSQSRRPSFAERHLALLGRSSLTHYLLHICLMLVPLRLFISDQEWTDSVGVMAFAAYVSIAVPLTVLWFRRFKRGPAEALWAVASGH
jgi:non-ribosomal peptide synthetase-like protein